MRTLYIYKITNNVNGKTYIGQRHCPENKTPWTDTKYMGSGKNIRCAEDKYGLDNFSKEIIAICYDEKILDILEIQYIKLYREINKAEYNIADGGDGGNAFKGRHHTEGHKKLMSLKMKEFYSHKVWTDAERNRCRYWLGKKHDEIYKKNMSKSCKGINEGPKSEETKRKISETLKGNIPVNKGMKMDEEFCRKQVELKRELYDSQKGEITKQKLREVNVDLYYWNDGKIEIHSKEYPGKGFSRGRLNSRAVRKYWYTNGHVDIFVDKCPEDYWYGRTFSDVKAHYWNDGKCNIFAVNCPGEGFVKGNLNCGKNVKGLFRWTDGKMNVCSKECPGEGFVRGITR